MSSRISSHRSVALLAACMLVSITLACQQQSEAPEPIAAGEKPEALSTEAHVQITSRQVRIHDWLGQNDLFDLKLTEDGKSVEIVSNPEYEDVLPRIAESASEIDLRFVHEMQAIANHYSSYGPALSKPGWGDMVSRLPRMERRDAVASMSDASNPAHGYRIYFTHARLKNSYLNVGIETTSSGEPRPIMQVLGNSERQAVVKETFSPRSIERTLARSAIRDDSSAPSDEMRTKFIELRGEPLSESGWPHYPASVEFDEAHYIPGEPTGLFIMFRPEHDLDATDAGWIYGTTNAAGEITACGDIPRCMSCHDKCAPGRVFGPQGSSLGHR